MSGEPVSRAWAQSVAVAALAVGAAWFAARHTPDAAIPEPYLPRSVAALDACRGAALVERPGEVVRVSTRIANGRSFLHLTIAAADNSEQVVICDGVSGARLRTIDLDDEGAARDGLK